ncbi:hypothetical protein Pres01_30880 [Metapseudomonas resinovorans]|nr:hypothetical protein Pres01_30880 [Pseudomonas resinovorans]
MLKPRELYRTQGFPDSYIIDRGHDGRRFSPSEQVHMCGNSFSPGAMAAIARATDPWKARQRQAIAAWPTLPGRHSCPMRGRRVLGEA